MMQTVSFQTAMAVTGLGRTSLWRRIAVDAAASETVGASKGHTKTRIDLERVLEWSALTVSDEDRQIILAADNRDADAQCDLGLMLLELGLPERAVHWLELAAAQGFADAMQWLGKCYARGAGVEQDEALAIDWLKKAACHGSIIAQCQIAELGLAA